MSYNDAYIAIFKATAIGFGLAALALVLALADYLVRKFIRRGEVDKNVEE